MTALDHAKEDSRYQPQDQRERKRRVVPVLEAAVEKYKEKDEVRDGTPRLFTLIVMRY